MYRAVAWLVPFPKLMQDPNRVAFVGTVTARDASDPTIKAGLGDQTSDSTRRSKRETPPPGEGQALVFISSTSPPTNTCLAASTDFPPPPTSN